MVERLCYQTKDSVSKLLLFLLFGNDYSSQALIIDNPMHFSNAISFIFAIELFLLSLLLLDDPHLKVKTVPSDNHECSMMIRGSTRVAFIAYGQLSESLFTFSKDWNDALGLFANVDIIYSVPLMNSIGREITKDEIQILRNHLLSLNGSSSVFIEESGIDFTNVASALVQQSGEPFYLIETKYITQRIWSLFLAIASSINLFSMITKSSCYDFVVVGRLNSLAATNLDGNKCLQAINKKTLPLLRPPPSEYYIEDRLMALPPCLLDAFGKAMGDPAHIFLYSASELNLSYPTYRAFEYFVLNALSIAVKTDACKSMPVDFIEPTCVENVWAIPVNWKKYQQIEVDISKSTYNYVQNELFRKNHDAHKLFGPKGAFLFESLSKLETSRSNRLQENRVKCVQHRVHEVYSLQEKYGWTEGLEASLNKPYLPQLRSVAVIVPVHLPNFKWVLKLVEDHVSCEFLWDLFIIFSSKADVVVFESLLKFNLQGTYSVLVMPHFRSTINNDIEKDVVIKKWWALAIIHTCYEYAVIFDSNTLITSPKLFANAVRESAVAGNVYQVYQQVAEHDQCYLLHKEFNNTIINAHASVLGSISMLPLYMIDVIFKSSKNCSMFSWFSDIPIYLTSDVRFFFSDINWPRNCCVFDHMTYQMWKIARTEWQSIDLGTVSISNTNKSDICVWELLELQNDPFFWPNIRNRHYPGSQWRPWTFCKASPNVCTEDNGIFSIFNLDINS